MASWGLLRVLLLLLLHGLGAAAAVGASAPADKAYVLDYSDLGGKPYSVSFNKRAVLMNNKPAMLLSGSIHYPRSTPGMWPKLMAEARAAGLNTIESCAGLLFRGWGGRRVETRPRLQK